MKKSKIIRLITFGFFLMIFITVVSACNDEKSSENDSRMSIATGDDGGIYYTVGAGLSNIINENSDTLQTTTETTGGANENVRLVGSGDVQFGFGTPTADVLGYEGKEPFAEEYDDLREVIGGFQQPGLFV